MAMKKIYLLIFCLGTYCAVNAQDPKYGLKAGINFATLTNTGGELKVGFNGGALAHIHLTPSFSLQPEVMYLTQGTKFSSSGDDKLLLNYINIPLLLQYNFDNGFRLQGGPQLGFLIEAKRKIGNVEFDRNAEYKSIDFSVPLGVSYLGYSGFGADARYNLGVTNVSEASNANQRNNVIQLGLFYLFDHKHKANSK
jgi:hypothetical protein